jgi:type II secretory pathway pseudopilin PulG
VAAFKFEHRCARCDGFSLGEVICGLAIAGIAVATIAPRVGAMRAALQLRAACVQLQSAIVRARIGALSQDQPWELRVLGATSYLVGPVAGLGGTEILPPGVAFSHTTSGGTVRFSPLGIAENATFDLTIGASTRQVVVNQRGKVDIQ